MRWSWVLVVAACSAPSPRPHLAHAPRTRAPISASPTCEDMGPLLRGNAHDDADDGAKKEAAIVERCVADAWPLEVLACVASAAEPAGAACLARLDEPTRTAFARIAEREAAELTDETDPPLQPSCADVVTGSALDGWPPAVTDADERTLALALRLTPLRLACEAGWDAGTKRCFVGTPAAGVGACIAQMAPASQQALTAAIADADQLRAKIVAARAHPPACDKVASLRYGAAKWTGKLSELTGAARSRMMAESRSAMRDSCRKGAGWSVDARACLGVDGGDRCFELAGESALVWQYPPLAAMKVPAKTGIAACDELTVQMERMATCEAVQEGLRVKLLVDYRRELAAWARAAPEQIPALASACETRSDEMLESVESLGC